MRRLNVLHRAALHLNGGPGRVNFAHTTAEYEAIELLCRIAVEFDHYSKQPSAEFHAWLLRPHSRELLTPGSQHNCPCCIC